ncbi:MAG: zinc ribbon domain-containing protein [Limnochordia bacterium]
MTCFARGILTSQTCSVYGHRQDIPLFHQVFTCAGCGSVVDRDQNAARNKKELEHQLWVRGRKTV